VNRLFIVKIARCCNAHYTWQTSSQGLVQNYCNLLYKIRYRKLQFALSPQASFMCPVSSSYISIFQSNNNYIFPFLSVIVVENLEIQLQTPCSSVHDFTTWSYHFSKLIVWIQKFITNTYLAASISCYQTGDVSYLACSCHCVQCYWRQGFIVVFSYNKRALKSLQKIL